MAGAVQHPDATPRLHASDHRDRQSRKLALALRRQREQELEILAAGQHGRHPLRIAGENGLGRRGERNPRGLDHGAEARGLADMAEVARQPIGDIHAGRRQPHEALTQRDAGLRQVLSVHEGVGALA